LHFVGACAEHGHDSRTSSIQTSLSLNAAQAGPTPYDGPRFQTPDDISPGRALDEKTCQGILSVVVYQS